MKDKISVIVPVYNVEEYLDRCVQSIVAQTYNNLEIILVDDGSTDLSGEVCDKWAEMDERIQVIHNSHHGSVYTRKTGVLAATGSYTCFVDSDDWIDKNCVEFLFECLKREGVSFVISHFCGANMLSRNPVFEERRYDCQKEADFVYGNMLAIHGSLCGKLFETNLIRKCQLDEDDRITYADDGACVWNYFLNVDSFYITYEEYYHYEKRENSITTAKRDEEYWAKINYLYNYVRERFQKHKYADVLIEQLNNYTIKGRLFVLDKIMPEKKIVSVYAIPYEKIPAGANILLYGAGAVGESIYYQLKENNFCNVIGWCDKDYIKYENQGVLSVQEALLLEYDYVILATIHQKIKESMKIMFENNGGDSDKIIDCEIRRTSMFMLRDSN